MRRATCFVLLACFILPHASIAADRLDTHQHGAPGSKGEYEELAGYEAELVKRRGHVRLYLWDHSADKAVVPFGMIARVLFVQGSVRKGSHVLTPAGDHFEIAAPIPKGSAAIVTLRAADGEAASARFGN